MLTVQVKTKQLYIKSNLKYMYTCALIHFYVVDQRLANKKPNVDQSAKESKH